MSAYHFFQPGFQSTRPLHLPPPLTDHLARSLGSTTRLSPGFGTFLMLRQLIEALGWAKRRTGGKYDNFLAM